MDSKQRINIVSPEDERRKLASHGRRLSGTASPRAEGLSGVIPCCAPRAGRGPLPKESVRITPIRLEGITPFGSNPKAKALMCTACRSWPASTQSLQGCSPKGFKASRPAAQTLKPKPYCAPRAGRGPPSRCPSRCSAPRSRAPAAARGCTGCPPPPERGASAAAAAPGHCGAAGVHGF